MNLILMKTNNLRTDNRLYMSNNKHFKQMSCDHVHNIKNAHTHTHTQARVRGYTDYTITCLFDKSTQQIVVLNSNSSLALSFKLSR